MDALTVGHVGKPCRWWRRVADWPAIAHIGPQACGLGLAVAGASTRPRPLAPEQIIHDKAAAFRAKQRSERAWGGAVKPSSP